MRPLRARTFRYLMAVCAALVVTTQIGSGVQADTASPPSDLANALARMRETPPGARLWAFTKACGCVRLTVVDSLVMRRRALVQPLYGETRTTMSASSFRARVRISRLALRDGVAPLTLYHELRHVVLSHAQWRARRSRRSPSSADYRASHARVDTYSDPSVLEFIARVPEVRQILVSKGLPSGADLAPSATPDISPAPPPIPPGGGSGPL